MITTHQLKEITLIEWPFLKVLNVQFIILYDHLTQKFLLSVTLISIRVLFFSSSYISINKTNKKFYFLLVLFVLIIFILIISPNIIRIMLGWDGLGITSYLLVIYYNSNKSNTSGLVTLLTNRFGDALILTSIFWCLKNFSWILDLNSFFSKIFILLFMVGLITKSAQIPFSSWLPAAIAAPTPISSLVHSSTLVTAGVYILIRIARTLRNFNFSKIYFFIGVSTTAMARLIATKENDIKKIVALSTLRQLGIMVALVGLKCWLLSFAHLLNHAFLKALLFISTGTMIHSTNDSQDLKRSGNKNFVIKTTFFLVTLTALNITGITFLRAFFVKEIIIEELVRTHLSFAAALGFLITIFLTPYYCIRRLLIFFIKVSKLNAKNFNENSDFEIKLSIFLLFIPIIISPSIFHKNWFFKEQSPIIAQQYLFLLLLILTAFITLIFLQTSNNLTKKKNKFFFLILGLTYLCISLISTLTLNQYSKTISNEKNFLNGLILQTYSPNPQINKNKIILTSILLISLTVLILVIRYYLNNII